MSAVKEIISIQADEMLISKDGKTVNYMNSNERRITLERLSSMEVRTIELFDSTYTYLMNMEPPVGLRALRKDEYYKISTLLLKTLSELHDVSLKLFRGRCLHTEVHLDRAQEEVERRLYGKSLKLSVNEELFNG